MSSLHPKYRADIDGLRALAVLLVVAFHAFPRSVPGGFVGVDVFFVISGFLISTILFENMKAGTFTFKDFYIRRVRRIFPTLIVVLLSCLIFGWFNLLDDEYKQLAKHVVGGALFVANFVLWGEAGYFDNAAEAKPLLHLWSLGIEEQFYILWPIALWLIWKLRQSFLYPLIIIGLASFALNLFVIQHDAIAAFYSPQTRFWEMLAGSALAWYKLYGKKSPSLSTRINFSISTLGLIFILVASFVLNKHSLFPGYWALMPVVGAVCLIGANQGNWINKKILSNRWMVGIGLISYPLYLWHYPLLSFLRILSHGTPSSTYRWAAVILAFILSWLTYKLVEQPLRFSKKLRHPVLVLCTSLIIVSTFGFIVYKNNGFKSRIMGLAAVTEQLTYNFPNNELCKSTRPYAVQSCYESEKRYPETIYLIGDSHMEALAYGFKHHFDFQQTNDNIVAIGQGGCNPLMNVNSFTVKGADYKCQPMINEALIEAFAREDVPWIILVGRHSARYRPTDYAEPEGDKPWRYVYNNGSVVSKDASEAFLLGLKETLDKAAAANKKILFVHQVPDLVVDPRDCISTESKKIDLEKCQLTRQEAEAQLSNYQAPVEALLKNYNNVYIYNPFHIFCDKDFCYGFNEHQKLMYRDHDHMSKQASILMAADILDFISTKK